VVLCSITASFHSVLVGLLVVEAGLVLVARSRRDLLDLESAARGVCLQWRN
jgi:hypothetical protein